MDDDLPVLPLYVDDWLGGTLSMPQAMRGAYLSLLITQWKSREIQAIKDDKKTLKIACGGPFPSELRSKFVQIHIDGQPYLRNQRLAEVYKERIDFHKRAAEKAKNAANSRWGSASSNATRNAPGMPQAMLGGMPSHVPYPNKGSSVPKIDSKKENKTTTTMRGGVVENRSRYTWNQCLDFANAEPHVTNPAGFAKKCLESGDCDHRIAAFLEPTADPEPDPDRPQLIRQPDGTYRYPWEATVPPSPIRLPGEREEDDEN